MSQAQDNDILLRQLADNPPAAPKPGTIAPSDAGGAGTDPSTTQVVSFPSITPQVVTVTSGVPATLSISWDAAPTVEIKSIAWVYYDPDIEQTKEIKGEMQKGFDTSGFLTNQSDTGVTLNGLPLLSFHTGRDGPSVFTKPQNVRIDWEVTDGASGETYSPYFGFVKLGDTGQAALLMENMALGPNRDGVETTDSVGSGPGSETSGTETTPIPSSTSTSNIDDPSSSDGGGGSKGISTGAIAGAAAGGAVFLALIGLLIFFLLRRRRRNKARKSNYTDQQHTSAAFIVDKSPHQAHAATYSEDSQQSAAMITEPAADTRDSNAAQDTEERSFSPWRDQVAASSAPRNGSQTPQSMSRTVQHLVEEGMTEDEIRRLEDEERELDDEIERARRRRRKPT